MSFNIRLGLGIEDPSGKIYQMSWGRELGGVINAIRSMDPDIVGLQEVAGVNQIRKLAQAVNMNYAFEWHQTGSSRKPWWGVGILSKYEIRSSRGVQISSGRGNTKHVVIATVDAGGQDITFVSVHKDKDLFDGNSITRILNEVVGRTEPIVLIGDFNITPQDSRLDVIRERYVDTATAVDTERAKEAVKRGTFYWSGRRIDYVFADKASFEVLDSGLVLKKHWKASDHIAYSTKLILSR